MELLYIIDMAEIPTFQEKPDIDLDDNGQIEPNEKEAYLSKKVQQLTEGLFLKLNGTPLSLEKSSEQLDILPGGLNLPTMKVTLRYRSGFPAAAGLHVLEFQDNNFGGRVGWKEIVVQADEQIQLVESSAPSTDKSQGLTFYPEDPTVVPPQDLSAMVRFRVASQLSGTSFVAGISGIASGFSAAADSRSSGVRAFPQNDPKTQREQQRLTQLLTSSTLSMNVIVLAMMIAFGLGAFHALSPGHGKTVVGAYLVGSRGTARHAILLGAIVTITHTLGVFILGLVTLYASKYILPEKLYPWLGFFSGLAVVVIGLGLFLQRYRALYAVTPAGRSPDHTHGVDQSHLHTHDHQASHSHQHSHEHHHSNHDPDYLHLDRGHCHAHEHGHHDHNHGHSHDLLTHSHGGVTHTHDYSNVRFKDLLTLGVTGGMVPCPSALVVLLSAISLNRVGLGLLMIVAFSLGLALVLMAIGLMMVYAREFLERATGKRGRIWRILPVFSPLIIAVLGAVIAVEALISGGIVQIQVPALK